MNFLALVQRLHSETLRSTAAPTTVVAATGRTARLVNAVADAWTELQSEQDWRWMRATTDAPLVIGQQTYTGANLGIATRFGRWRKDDDTYCAKLYQAGSPNSMWDLSLWDLDCFRDQYVYRDMGQSTPLAWAIDEQERLIVGPAPSVAYKLRAEYWLEPSALAADADAPDMPDRFHLILVWRALQDIAKADAAPELLAKAEKNYGDMKDKLMFDQSRLPHL